MNVIFDCSVKFRESIGWVLMRGLCGHLLFSLSCGLCPDRRKTDRRGVAAVD